MLEWPLSVLASKQKETFPPNVQHNSQAIIANILFNGSWETSPAKCKDL